MLHCPELMLNFTGLGKEAEMLMLRFVLIIFLHATGMTRLTLLWEQNMIQPVPKRLGKTHYKESQFYAM